MPSVGFAYVGHSYPAFVGLGVVPGLFVAQQRPFAPRVRLTRRSTDAAACSLFPAFLASFSYAQDTTVHHTAH